MFEYITKRRELEAAAIDLVRECKKNTYVDEFNVQHKAHLFVDLETYRPDANRNKPITCGWNGKEWSARARLFAIAGYTDRQYILDVKRLGEMIIAATLEDPLDMAVCVAHNAKYDMTFLDALFDMRPKFIDTRLLSQILLAGKRCGHALMDCYRRCIPCRRFEKLVNATHERYAIETKSQLQKSDWSADELSQNQLQYSADDVRLLPYVYERLMDDIEEHERVHESKYKKNKGIFHIIKLEHKVLPVFVRMELRGLRCDTDHHDNVVIPLLEERREEARRQFTQWDEFRRRRVPGEYSLLYVAKPDIDDDIKALAKNIRTEIRINLKDRIRALSVKTKSHAEGDQIHISWCSDEDLTEEVKEYADCWAGFVCEFRDDSLINLNHPETVAKALKKVMGFKVATTNAKYLKRLLLTQADEYQAEVLTWLIRYNKAKTYAAKFGRNFRNYLNERGYFYPSWNQIGSDRNEIVSGRSSSSEPNLMAMPSKDMLFAYSEDGGVKAPELLRSLILPPRGCVFINADYSTIEPRMTAWLSKDKNLIKAIREGVDLHKLTAGIILKLDESMDLQDIDPHWLAADISSDDRNKIGKPLNLGITYCMGPTALVDHVWNMTDGQIVWDVKTARRNIDMFFRYFSGVAEAIDKTEDVVCKRVKAAGSVAFGKDGSAIGKTVAEDGRHRFLFLPDGVRAMDEEELHADYNPTGERWFYNEYKRRISKMRRDGWNHRIQSSCAGMLKAAEVLVDRELEIAFANHPQFNSREMGLQLVLHDELLVSVPDDEESIAKGMQIVESQMIRAAGKYINLDVVPVKVGIKWGRNWYDASPK